ncbi:hypothetical protein [Candidatus Nitrospira neomarina]|uniref:Uncharacterized protein n=1 Tax=Candidatus Nitrospira neomarina TaxID=3020899 RepID=A0AA96JZF4_9BACT|nr:hypothetical protein [Candidatus Nitrospira neomarina]WNM61081.1 hypothetical protein PQG83_15140 [Candidatus Nitrospira neomarina]
MAWTMPTMDNVQVGSIRPFFKEINEIHAFACVTEFHRLYIEIANLVDLGQQLDLGQGHRLL